MRFLGTPIFDMLKSQGFQPLKLAQWAQLVEPTHLEPAITGVQQNMEVFTQNHLSWKSAQRSITLNSKVVILNQIVTL